MTTRMVTPGRWGEAGSGHVGSVTGVPRRAIPTRKRLNRALKSKRSRFLRSDSSTFPDRVGVCSIRRECLPNCLCTGYQCILATGSRFAGNGDRHRWGGSVRLHLLLVFADFFVRLHAHRPHALHYSGPRRLTGVIRILSNTTGRYCRSPAYRRRVTPGGPPARPCPSGSLRRRADVTVDRWPAWSSTSPRCASTVTSAACGPVRWFRGWDPS